MSTKIGYIVSDIFRHITSNAVTFLCKVWLHKQWAGCRVRQSWFCPALKRRRLFKNLGSTFCKNWRLTYLNNEANTVVHLNKKLDGLYVSKRQYVAVGRYEEHLYTYLTWGNWWRDLFVSHAKWMDPSVACSLSYVVKDSISKNHSIFACFALWSCDGPQVHKYGFKGILTKS